MTAVQNSRGSLLKKIGAFHPSCFELSVIMKKEGQ